MLNNHLSVARMRFLIVTGFTSFNLLLGMLSLLAAVAGFLSLAAWFLLACVILDGCDGPLARHWQVSTAFGGHLDSLADMTAFVIAAAMLAYFWLQPELDLVLASSIVCLFVLAGAIRLARFNASFFSNSFFQGLPTTFVGVIVAITYLTVPHLDSLWGAALIFMLAVLMVSIFPYPKLAYLRKAPMWIWGIALVSLLINLPWTIWISTLIYMASGPIIWLIQQIRHKETPQDIPSDVT